MFKEDPEEIIANKMIQEADLSDSALSAQEKIISSSYGIGDSVREPKTIILQWMFMVYQDMKHNSVIVKDTLKDAKDFTGSRLMKIEIDKTIQAIDNISTQTVLEDCPIGKAFERKGLISLSEISLFKSLKSNGLKSIEDALYEYTIRAKNCDTEEDAMFIIRSINTRLNILEDYIYNTPELSETDRKHWESVAQKYRQLREVVVKKKISKKQYGLFFDYSALDQLDKSED
jgi:predicted RNA-binding protein